MNAAPPWLIIAIDRANPDMLGGDRDRLAAAIFEAFEEQRLRMRDAYKDAATTVLKQRGIQDSGDDIARELANNGTQDVLFALSEGM